MSVTLKVNGDRCPRCRCGCVDPPTWWASIGIRWCAPIRVPNTTDFEPNCFPSIEFDRADFPWLFTPARANTNGQLRPWLCLVVVREQDGVQLTSTVDAPLPTLKSPRRRNRSSSCPT